tara:strand:+ start:186 stop:701 length:516 start_codon:yes stop_codon:yes gene_type:complete
MIVFENDFLDLKIDEKNVLIAHIKENSCDNSYIQESINQMIEGIRNIYISYQKINKPLGLLFDARNLSQILPISSIWNIAKFFGGTKDITEEIVVGSAIITSSDIVITLVNAFSKLYQNVKPMKFSKDIEEGYSFLYDLFENINSEDVNNNEIMDISDVNNLVDKYIHEGS